MNADTLKMQISMPLLLGHLGSQCKGSRWQCLQPANHNNGDSNFSTSIHDDHLTCNSQGCFKNDDIFDVIGKVKNIL